MLHLVTKDNRSLYARELDDLHRVRKSVFVDELGWRLNVVDGREIDAYDDDRAIYGIGFDYNGRVTMSGRYRPTDDRSMLMDVFPHSLTPGLGNLNGPDTWEFSRGFCLETGGKRHNQQRRAMLMLTPLEIAYACGISSYIAFSEVRLLPLFINMGWRVTLLGDPVSYGEGEGIAYRVEVSEEAIRHMRETYDLPAPCHIHLLPDANDTRSVHERAREIADRAPLYASIMPQATDRPYVARSTSRGIDQTRLRRRAYAWTRENQYAAHP
ncbi:acyl-homoserine-lactone synthase [Sphingomonas sp. SCN 67-18]|uniref:acyl-homoserine-lactone synthase n=1 Tax=uncultured Sphingomonas sp. TaxID=158754 RepID=UPI0025CCC948|nr:acyl-homoserine-lactone synthase [Sphingomonas sp. SCN 67-18]